MVLSGKSTRLKDPIFNESVKSQKRRKSNKRFNFLIPIFGYPLLLMFAQFFLTLCLIGDLQTSYTLLEALSIPLFSLKLANWLFSLNPAMLGKLVFPLIYVFNLIVVVIYFYTKKNYPQLNIRLVQVVLIMAILFFAFGFLRPKDVSWCNNAFKNDNDNKAYCYGRYAALSKYPDICMTLPLKNIRSCIGESILSVKGNSICKFFKDKNCQKYCYEYSKSNHFSNSGISSTAYRPNLHDIKCGE